MIGDYRLFKITPLPFIYAGVGGVACILNTWQILLIMKKEKNKTAFDNTLVSLAISDLLYAICSLVTPMTLKYLPSHHSWFKPSVSVIFSAGTFTISSSVFHVVYIAIERIILVYYPLKHIIFVRRRIGLIVIAIVWFLSLFTTIICTVYMHNTYKDIVVASASSLNIGLGLAVLILYLSLVLKLKQISKVAREGINHGSTIAATTSRRQKRVMINSFAVTLVYIGCIYPPCITNVIQDKEEYYFYVGIFLSLQCVLDPLVYFFIHYCRRTTPRQKDFENQNR